MSLYTKAKKLREERQKDWEAMKDLQVTIAKEERGFTDEEQAKWDQINEAVDQRTEEIEKVEAQLKAHEDRGERIDSLGDTLGRSLGFVPPNTNGEAEVGEPKVSQRDAVINWLRGGPQALTPEQRQSIDTSIPKGIPASGPGITFRYAPEEQRAQAAGTNSTGGYTVDSIMGPRIVETMAQYGSMWQPGVCTIINTDGGEQMNIPTNNDTSNVGALLAENASDSETALTFGTKALNAYKYTSGTVLVSLELLQDSSFDIEAFVAKKLAERLGRGTNAALTTANGSDKPNGIVSASTVGKYASATAALTFDELLDLKHSVDPAYRMNGKWMLNDAVLKYIKQLSIGTTDARPLWQPSVIVGEPATIDGDQYIINQNMASTITTSAKTVLYGDLTSYWIRRAREITLIRLSERYAEYYQVGFLAFMRCDGDLIDTSGVKVLSQATA